MKAITEIKTLLASKGLKVTLPRIAVYQAMETLGHACAEDVAGEVRKTSPTISVSTIYNVLDSFVESGVLKKVMMFDNKMYFDVNTDEHNHLYSVIDNRIVDYDDPTLIHIIKDYLNTKGIKDFEPEEIKVQLIGRFKE